MADPIPSPSTAAMRGIRRAFTLPTKLVEAAESVESPRSGAVSGSQDIETLFACHYARIFAFDIANSSRTVSSKRSPIAGDVSLGDEGSGTLPWRTQAERLVAAGPLRIYRVPGSVAFLNAGMSFLRPILAKSQCWCVDGETQFALRKGMNDFYRIELPNENQQDKDLAIEFGKALDEILRYEKTPCPFKRGFSIEIPESPQVTYVPWKPKHKPISPLRRDEWDASPQTDTGSIDLSVRERYVQVTTDTSTSPLQEVCHDGVESSTENSQTPYSEISPFVLRGLRHEISVKDTIGKFEDLDREGEKSSPSSAGVSKLVDSSHFTVRMAREGQSNISETSSDESMQTINTDLIEPPRYPLFPGGIDEQPIGLNNARYEALSSIPHQSQSPTQQSQQCTNESMFNVFEDSAKERLIEVQEEDIKQITGRVSVTSKTYHAISNCDSSIERLRTVDADQSVDFEHAENEVDQLLISNILSTQVDDTRMENLTRRSSKDPAPSEPSHTDIESVLTSSDIHRNFVEECLQNGRNDRLGTHDLSGPTELLESSSGFFQHVNVQKLETQSPKNYDMSEGLEMPYPLSKSDGKTFVKLHLSNISDASMAGVDVSASTVADKPERDIIRPDIVNSIEGSNMTSVETSAVASTSDLPLPIQPISKDLKTEHRGGLNNTDRAPSVSPALSATTSFVSSDSLHSNAPETTSYKCMDRGQNSALRSPTLRSLRVQLRGHDYEHIGAVIGEKMAGVLLGPPLQLANLMLRIATRFANGALVKDLDGKGWKRRNETGRRLPGMWDFLSDSEDFQGLHVDDNSLLL